MSAMYPGDIAKHLPPMPMEEALHQPDAVWRCVEREVLSAWAWKAREAWALARHKRDGAGMPHSGWLLPDPILFERLMALDIPVLHLFAACAIRQRDGVS